MGKDNGREKRLEQKAKLELALLNQHIGQPLTLDVYYGQKLVAGRGDIVTPVMLLTLQKLDPSNLFFSKNGKPDTAYRDTIDK